VTLEEILLRRFKSGTRLALGPEEGCSGSALGDLLRDETPLLWLRTSSCWASALRLRRRLPAPRRRRLRRRASITPGSDGDDLDSARGRRAGILNAELRRGAPKRNLVEASFKSQPQVFCTQTTPFQLFISFLIFKFLNFQDYFFKHRLYVTFQIIYLFLKAILQLSPFPPFFFVLLF